MFFDWCKTTGNETHWNTSGRSSTLKVHQELQGCCPFNLWHPCRKCCLYFIYLNFRRTSPEYTQWPLTNAGQDPPLLPEQPELFLAWIQLGFLKHFLEILLHHVDMIASCSCCRFFMLWISHSTKGAPLDWPLVMKNSLWDTQTTNLVPTIIPWSKSLGSFFYFCPICLIWKATEYLDQVCMFLFFWCFFYWTPWMVPFLVMKKICCVSDISWHRPMAYFADGLHLRASGWLCEQTGCGSKRVSRLLWAE